jgi:hypothetical protein
MLPQSIVAFYSANQELLWLTTLILDLGGTLVLYRLFGKAGLQVAIALFDTPFIYWAKHAYRQRHPAAAQGA